MPIKMGQTLKRPQYLAITTIRIEITLYHSKRVQQTHKSNIYWRMIEICNLPNPPHIKENLSQLKHSLQPLMMPTKKDMKMAIYKEYVMVSLVILMATIMTMTWNTTKQVTVKDTNTKQVTSKDTKRGMMMVITMVY